MKSRVFHLFLKHVAKLLSVLVTWSVAVFSTANTVESILPFSQQAFGKQAIPLSNKQDMYWLTTSATHGLRLFNQSGHALMQTPGNFEALSFRTGVRVDDGKLDILAALDIESDTVKVFWLNWSASRFEPLVTLINSSAQTEVLCWHRDAQQNLSLFTVDVTGMVQQHLLFFEHSRDARLISLRQFVGVPNVTGCAVDDQNENLYLTEESVGVWRYPANPEAELERNLVIATAPIGAIEGEIKGIAVAPGGQIFVSAPEQRGIWHIAADSALPPEFIALTHTTAPEALAAHVDRQSVTLAVFDDGNDNYVSLHTQSAPLAGKRENVDRFIQLSASAQTAPVDKFGDAADDPAIWVNKIAPEDSLILGTDKKRGLLSYNLAGQIKQRLDVGRINNVDVRYGLKVAGKTIDIAAGSNRSSNSISLFGIDQTTGRLNWLNDIATNLHDVYGLCMGKVNNRLYVYINSTDGRFQQYQLHTEGSKITGQLVREFSVSSQPEGCVVDDATEELYYGEEGAGVWLSDANPGASSMRLIATINQDLVADVEGMGIYRIDTGRYLVVSSQGNNSFAVFALDDSYRYLGSVQIAMDPLVGIDGVSETDGLEVLSTPLGSHYPQGIMVVQDGRNNMPSAPQNFKIISGSKVRQWIVNHL